jgi:hypothetical protein
MEVPVELLVLLLTLVVAFQLFRQRRLEQQLKQALAVNTAMQQHVEAAAKTVEPAAAAAAMPAPIAAAQPAPLAIQPVVRRAAGSESHGLGPEPEPEPPRPTGHELDERRWMCVGEVAQGEACTELWDGCGVADPAVLQGRMVAVEGSQVGRVVGVRTSRWGGNWVFSVADESSGQTAEHRLALEGTGTAFRVRDAQSVAQPWRWSFDDERRPWPPPPGWGFAGNLRPEQARACAEFVAAVRDETGVELATDAALLFMRATQFKARVAAQMFHKGAVWREENRVVQLMADTVHR